MINGTSASQNSAAFAGTSAPAKSDAAAAAPLGRDTFLKLMLAQMKNQDPFNAQDPSQFLSQLAQFSQVSGIENMQKSLESLSGAMRSSSALQGTSLVGHDVLAPGSLAQLDVGGHVSGAVDVPDGTSSIDVSIRDTSGAVVRRFSIPPTGNVTEFHWDGSDDAGAAAPAGKYRLQTNAHIGNATQSLQPLLQSRVTSVTVSGSDGSMTLNTPTGSLTLADVRRVM